MVAADYCNRLVWEKGEVCITRTFKNSVFPFQVVTLSLAMKKADFEVE